MMTYTNSAFARCSILNITTVEWYLGRDRLLENCSELTKKSSKNKGYLTKCKAVTSDVKLQTATNGFAI